MSLLETLRRAFTDETERTGRRHCSACTYPYSGETCPRCGGDGPDESHPAHPGDTETEDSEAGTP